MADNIGIRPIGENEREAWNPLWAGYLAYYKSALTQEISDLAWDRFHNPDEPLFALGGYVDGELMGIAHYLFHRSTWAPHRNGIWKICLSHQLHGVKGWAGP
jgi:hypothetical protein